MPGILARRRRRGHSFRRLLAAAANSRPARSAGVPGTAHLTRRLPPATQQVPGAFWLTAGASTGALSGGEGGVVGAGRGAVQRVPAAAAPVVRGRPEAVPRPVAVERPDAGVPPRN